PQAPCHGKSPAFVAPPIRAQCPVSAPKALQKVLDTRTGVIVMYNSRWQRASDDRNRLRDSPLARGHKRKSLKENNMKCLRLMLSLVLMSVPTLAFAQTVPSSDAQRSFALLKTLAGTWQASVTVDPPQPEMGNGAMGQISLRVTSRGNALVHEMHEAGKP